MGKRRQFFSVDHNFIEILVSTPREKQQEEDQRHQLVTRNTNPMKRRGAFISPRPLSPMAPNSFSSCTGRKFQRRFAFCDSPAMEKAMRKAQLTCAGRSSAELEDTDVLFHVDGKAYPDHEGNKLFKSVIETALFDTYQFAVTPTHRSIVRSTVLDEMKCKGHTFKKKCERDDGSSFEVLDDIDVLRIIRKSFRDLMRAQGLQRSISDKSVGIYNLSVRTA